MLYIENMVGVQFTSEQRSSIVERYFATQNCREVIRQFTIQFPNRRPPTSRAVLYNVRKYQEHGTSLNRNAFNSGRPRTARIPQNIELVRQAMQENPRVSIRRNGTGLPRSTFNRITHLDLNFHPYQMIRRHELRENDRVRRQAYSRWFLQQCQLQNFLQNVIIGDEATFRLNGSVNTRNIREYAPKGQPPDFFYDRLVSREKVNVWAGMCGNGTILGPFFFDVNISGRVYLNMLNEQVVPEMMENFQYNLWRRPFP